jgi:signal transduction histidine kinase
MMMRNPRTILGWVFAFALMFGASGAGAIQYGTTDEATALVTKAAAFYKANGKDKLLAEIDNPDGQFVSHDLYVVAYAVDGTRLAHPYNKTFIGKSVADAVDSDGKHYGQEELAIIKGKGSGWVDYKYPDPVTKKPVEKSFYVYKVDDQIFLGCGVYKR